MQLREQISNVPQAVVCMCPVDVHPDCKEGLAAKTERTAAVDWAVSF